MSHPLSKLVVSLNYREIKEKRREAEHTMCCSALPCFGHGSDANQIKMHSLTSQTMRNLDEQNGNHNQFSEVHDLHANTVSRFTVRFPLLGCLRLVLIRR